MSLSSELASMLGREELSGSNVAVVDIVISVEAEHFLSFVFDQRVDVF